MADCERSNRSGHRPASNWGIASLSLSWPLYTLVAFTDGGEMREKTEQIFSFGCGCFKNSVSAPAASQTELLFTNLRCRPAFSSMVPSSLSISRSSYLYYLSWFSLGRTTEDLNMVPLLFSCPNVFVPTGQTCILFIRSKDWACQRPGFPCYTKRSPMDDVFTLLASLLRCQRSLKRKWATVQDSGLLSRR